MKIGFDNDKYLAMQSEHIRERIKKFDNKLYLEFGGKLFDDYHASRVLPGFQPDSKLQMLLQLKEQEYVTAARALGASSGRIIRKHLLTNCIGTLIVTTTLQIPSAIFTESFLSFLGIGVAVPMPSLGSLANDALNGLQSYPYRLLAPALLISIIILSFNLLGDGLRDAFDPKMKE